MVVVRRAARGETTNAHYAPYYVYNTQSAVSRQVMTQTIQRYRAFPWLSVLRSNVVAGKFQFRFGGAGRLGGERNYITSKANVNLACSIN